MNATSPDLFRSRQPDPWIGDEIEMDDDELKETKSSSPVDEFEEEWRKRQEERQRIERQEKKKLEEYRKKKRGQSNDGWTKRKKRN
jgi:hypothetical protein